MKRFRAVVLYKDGTFEAWGSDNAELARDWCMKAHKRSGREVFWSFVNDSARDELTYTDLE